MSGVMRAFSARALKINLTQGMGSQLSIPPQVVGLRLVLPTNRSTPSKSDAWSMFYVNELPRICRANTHVQFTVDSTVPTSGEKKASSGTPSSATTAAETSPSLHLILKSGKQVDISASIKNVPSTPSHIYQLLVAALDKI